MQFGVSLSCQYNTFKCKLSLNKLKQQFYVQNNFTQSEKTKHRAEAIFGLHNMVCFYFHHINALVWDGWCATLVLNFLQDFGALVWTGMKVAWTQCMLVFASELVFEWNREILSLDSILLGKEKDWVVAWIWALMTLDFGLLDIIFWILLALVWTLEALWKNHVKQWHILVLLQWVHGGWFLILCDLFCSLFIVMVNACETNVCSTPSEPLSTTLYPLLNKQNKQMRYELK